MKQAVQASAHNLALTVPQIEQAEAALAAAQADLASAQLQLEKTRLLAPFDGQVLNSTLDVGEFAVAGQQVGALYAVSSVEIPVPVPLDELRWLPALSTQPMPVDAGAESEHPPLPSAAVHWQGGGRHYTWRGKVARWEAGLDPGTRTVTLVIEVADPWASFRPGEHPCPAARHVLPRRHCCQRDFERLRDPAHSPARRQYRLSG